MTQQSSPESLYPSPPSTKWDDSYPTAPESAVQSVGQIDATQLQTRLRLPVLWGQALTVNHLTYASRGLAEAFEGEKAWSTFVSDVIERCYAGCSEMERRRVIALARNINILDFAGTWLPGGNEQSVVANMTYLLSLWDVDKIIETYQLHDPCVIEAMVAAWRDMPVVVDMEWKIAGRSLTTDALMRAAVRAYGEHDDNLVNAFFHLCALSSAYARTACANDVIYKKYAVASAEYIRHSIEVSMRSDRVAPSSVRALIDRRIFDSAVAPTQWNLLAVSGMAELDAVPASLCEHPSFTDAMTQVCAHIGLVNDVFSYDREQVEETDAQVNFVDYARHTLVANYSLSAAIDRTFEEANLCMRRFVAAVIELEACFGVAGTFAGQAMLRSMLGNICWSMDAPRYSMKDVVWAACTAA